MKHFAKLAFCLLLALSMMTSAFAAEVPDSLVTENLNGQQRLIKTYTLSPDVDPDTLQEEDFTYDGFLTAASNAGLLGEFSQADLDTARKYPDLYHKRRAPLSGFQVCYGNCYCGDLQR